MKYFAKYLPVEGEIKDGDLNCWWIEGKHGDIVIANGGGKRSEKFKKVKLFLCSRDIVVGDRVWYMQTNQYVILEGEAGNNLNKEPKNWLHTKCSEDILSCGWYLFKVMGEISPEAIWVKEGDEFEEDEWGYYYDNEDLGGIDKSYYIVIHSKPVTILKIKGPCGHFH